MRRSDLVAVIVFAVAACTAPTAASPMPSASAAVAMSPSPSPSRRSSPSPTPSPFPSPGRSFALPSPLESPFAPDLEARLPAELRGIPMIRVSAPLSRFAGGGDMCIVFCADEPGRLAKAAAMDLADLTVAMAIPPDDSGLAVGIVAIRFPGLDTDELIPTRLKAGGHSSGRPILPETKTLKAGEELVTWVQWLPHFPEAGQVEYLYARDDVLFILDGLPPEGDRAPADVTLAVGALARS